MMSAPSPQLLSVAIPAMAFLAAFQACVRIVSLKSGWEEIARHYRAQGSFAGRRWRFRTVFLGFTTYPFLTLGSSAEGLYLRVPFFMRWGHPPLLVPWSAIRIRRHRLWLMESWEFHIRHEKNGDGLWVSRRLGARLVEAAGGAARG